MVTTRGEVKEHFELVGYEGGCLISQIDDRVSAQASAAASQVGCLPKSWPLALVGSCQKSLCEGGP